MYSLDKCDETFLSEAPRRFVYRLSTALSPEAVFDVVSDIIEVEREWFPHSVSAMWKTPPPHGAGSVREHRLKYMTLEEDFLIWQRGERLVLRVTKCSLPLLQTYLEDYRIGRMPDGRTELTWEICYRPRPALTPLHPILRPLFARDFAKAARGLEEVFTRLVGRSPAQRSAEDSES